MNVSHSRRDPAPVEARYLCRRSPWPSAASVPALGAAAAFFGVEGFRAEDFWEDDFFAVAFLRVVFFAAVFLTVDFFLDPEPVPLADALFDFPRAPLSRGASVAMMSRFLVPAPHGAVLAAMVWDGLFQRSHRSIRARGEGPYFTPERRG
jgi:hypothetical protein